MNQLNEICEWVEVLTHGAASLLEKHFDIDLSDHAIKNGNANKREWRKNALHSSKNPCSLKVFPSYIVHYIQVYRHPCPRHRGDTVLILHSCTCLFSS